MRLLLALFIIIAAWMLPIGTATQPSDVMWRAILSFVVMSAILLMSFERWGLWVAVVEGILNICNLKILLNWSLNNWFIINYDTIQRTGFTLELLIIAWGIMYGIDSRGIYRCFFSLFNRSRHL